MNNVNYKKNIIYFSGLVFIFLFPFILFNKEIKNYFYSEHPLTKGSIINFADKDMDFYSAGLTIDGDWKIYNGKISLKGNQKAKIYLKWEKYLKTRFITIMNFPFEYKNEITLSLNDSTGKLIKKYKFRNIQTKKFDWTKLLKNEKFLNLTIDFDLNGIGNGYYPVIDTIQISNFKPQTILILPWYKIFILIFCGFMILKTFILISNSIYPKKYFFYIGISWVVLTVLCKFISPIMNIVFLIFFVYAMMLLYAVIKYNKKILHEFSAYIIIGIILFTGFYMRWNALIFYEGIKLEYDAEDYYNISTKYSKGLFDTAAERPPYIREPFYIWILKCGFLFFPKTPEALRIIALIISLISIYSTFLFGKKYLGYLTGLGTSAYMSVSESFINAGVQGLREDLYLCILILFLYQLIKKEKKMSFGITIGISAGFLMLVRITAFSFIIPLIFIFSVIHRWKPINIVISLIVPFTMVIPHLIFNYNFMDSKDILYSGNIHTSFYRNYEFAGKPGFITREEFKTDPYHGGNISAFKYLFFEHSPVQIISGFTKGTIRIYLTSFTYDTLLNKNNILLVIYIIGIIGLIFSNQRWIFLIWFFISFPMLYLSSFVIVERLLLYLIPFQLYGIFAGWIKVSDYGKRFFR